MTTRVANRDDINELVSLRLVNAAYHAGLLLNVSVKSTAEAFFSAHTEKCIEDEQSVIFVGESNNNLMAYVIGQIDAAHPVLDVGITATIEDIFVHPTFERRGFGNQLVHEFERWFKKRGVERIDLNVYTSNVKGSAFWGKLGFKAMFKRMYKEL